MSPEYSVVLPAYNEGTGLVAIVDEVMIAMGKASQSFEVVIVDDGSTDNTWEVIGGLAEKHPEIRALSFARNFGHQLAVHAGIKAATGNVIAVMDSDGQDPADLLPVMFQKIAKEGYDVVNCVRTKRKESAFKKTCYFLFYRLYKRLVPFDMTVDSGDFSAMNRKTADIVSRVSQHAPFIRGIRSWVGGKQCELEYERQVRQSGEPKYSMVRLMFLAIDGITSFSKVPLRMSIVLGITISSASLLYAAWVFVTKLFGWYPESLRGWASQTFLIAFLGGMILTVLGIIGEYLGHIFDAVRGMPPYLVDKEIRPSQEKTAP